MYYKLPSFVERVRFALSRTVLLFVLTGLPVVVAQTGLSSPIGEECSEHHLLQGIERAPTPRTGFREQQ